MGVETADIDLNLPAQQDVPLAHVPGAAPRSGQEQEQGGLGAAMSPAVLHFWTEQQWTRIL